MRRSPVLLALVAAIAIMIGGCTDSTADSTRAAQASTAGAEAMLTAEGFGCRTLVVAPPVGAEIERCAWVADSPALRSRGLMGITDPTLGGRDAMVFTFDSSSTGAFWMKDTPIPLTLVWVGPDGTVMGSTDMTPCASGGSGDAATPRCPTYPPPGPFVMAIEVGVGRAEVLGLVVGAAVELGEPC